jgi:hypothetical protein
MRLGSTHLALATLVAGVFLVSAPALAEKGPSSDSLQRAEEDVARLRAELERVNREVAALKRAERSVRNDYRLRERMADAEAIAQRLTQAESRARTMGSAPPAPRERSPLDVPRPSPQDGAVELEAKADLLADQSRRLDREADRLFKAATELRARRDLRRKASAWDRDPFAGLESSKRSFAVATPATTKATGNTPLTGDTTRGGSTTTAPPPPTLTAGANSPEQTPTALTPGAAAGGGATMDTSKGPTVATSSETAAAAKTSPLLPTGTNDKQPFDQRLYLDPTTAAELRHALGTSSLGSDPDALEKAAATLRARSRRLGDESKALRVRSRMP